MGCLSLRELKSFFKVSGLSPSLHFPETTLVEVTSKSKYSGHFSVPILLSLPAASHLAGPSSPWEPCPRLVPGSLLPAGSHHALCWTPQSLPASLLLPSVPNTGQPAGIFPLPHPPVRPVDSDTFLHHSPTDPCLHKASPPNSTPQHPTGPLTSPSGCPTTQQRQISILTPPPPACPSPTLLLFRCSSNLPGTQGKHQHHPQLSSLPIPCNQSSRKFHWLCLHSLSTSSPLLQYIL